VKSQQAKGVKKMEAKNMKYNYAKLRGRIREVYGSEKKFAEAINLSPWAVSQRLNNSAGFRQPEISLCCNKLGLPIESVYEYFFTPLV